MSELEKVYNLGLQATQRKVFFGGVDHDYSKAGVGQIRVEAQSIKKDAKILTASPKTGLIETELASMKVNNVDVEKAIKGNLFTFAIDQELSLQIHFTKS